MTEDLSKTQLLYKMEKLIEEATKEATTLIGRCHRCGQHVGFKVYNGAMNDSFNYTHLVSPSGKPDYRDGILVYVGDRMHKIFCRFCFNHHDKESWEKNWGK